MRAWSLSPLRGLEGSTSRLKVSCTSATSRSFRRAAGSSRSRSRLASTSRMCASTFPSGWPGRGRPHSAPALQRGSETIARSSSVSTRNPVIGRRGEFMNAARGGQATRPTRPARVPRRPPTGLRPAPGTATGSGPRSPPGGSPRATPGQCRTRAGAARLGRGAVDRTRQGAVPAAPWPGPWQPAGVGGGRGRGGRGPGPRLRAPGRGGWRRSRRRCPCPPPAPPPAAAGPGPGATAPRRPSPRAAPPAPAPALSGWSDGWPHRPRSRPRRVGPGGPPGPPGPPPPPAPPPAPSARRAGAAAPPPSAPAPPPAAPPAAPDPGGAGRAGSAPPPGRPRPPAPTPAPAAPGRSPPPPHPPAASATAGAGCPPAPRPPRSGTAAPAPPPAPARTPPAPPDTPPQPSPGSPDPGESPSPRTRRPPPPRHRAPPGRPPPPPSDAGPAPGRCAAHRPGRAAAGSDPTAPTPGPGGAPPASASNPAAPRSPPPPWQPRLLLRDRSPPRAPGPPHHRSRSSHHHLVVGTGRVTRPKGDRPHRLGPGRVTRGRPATISPREHHARRPGPHRDLRQPGRLRLGQDHGPRTGPGSPTPRGPNEDPEGSRGRRRGGCSPREGIPGPGTFPQLSLLRPPNRQAAPGDGEHHPRQLPRTGRALPNPSRRGDPMDCVLINLTPHAIDVVDPESGGLVASLPPEPEPARAEMEREQLGTVVVNGTPIPVTRNRLGTPSSLPEPAPGRYYIVSRTYAEAVRASGRSRSDLLVPDDPVRDEEGRITGCRGFAVID